MLKYLEVGALVFAGMLTVPLVISMNSTQERLNDTKAAKLNASEDINRSAVERLLMLQSMPDVAPKDTKQIKEQKDSEVLSHSKKCFKVRECAKLAEAIYFEDRGDMDGMKAVANVVMNRVNSGKYPNSVSGVVNQRKWTKSGWVCQFSYMCQLKDRSMTDEESRYKAGYVAWKATNGVLKDTTKGADHYLNKSKVKTLPTWVYAFNRTVKIGDHTFYASKDI
ncbi:Spore cortex-lytic enzyme precursor [compost metagenome]